ncbi:hypothetical protein [Actinophytocola xanthii]|uniref:hypothetical protein n=1 Tax=Actinophytocola xanthii TaxID=1912961 RepID=UPI0013013178|nr:hypothetical protein [Actinophytocola xanthii]
MSLSRAAVFTARIAAVLGATAIAVGAPIAISSTVSAGDAPPSQAPTATTNGHSWIG